MRPHGLWSRQITPTTVLGLAAAVLAEVGSIGLLGTSGWFISASAIAGVTAFSTFSYVAPSATVRAFALIRITANYVQRLLQHRGALRRLRDIRLEFFAASAAAVAAPARGGRLLDRAMADADTESLHLIRTIQPIVVYITLSLASITLVAAVSTPAALVLAGACALAALIAFAGDRMHGTRTSDDGVDRARAGARTEVVTAVEAWPEIVSMGAIDRVVQELGDRIARYTLARRRAGARDAVGASQLGVVVALALAAVVVVTALLNPIPAPGVVLIALVTAGLMTIASRLPAAFRNDREARDAAERLNTAVVEKAVDNSPTAEIARTAEGGVALVDYRVPESLFAREHHVSATVLPGECLVVTGRSGSGKSTLLASMFESLEGAGGHQRVVFVPTDDYLFTGTIAENMRLADPDVTETGILRVLAEMRLDGFAGTTRIGVGGRNTSGGEQTRLRIARGLLAKPDVLLVDEPTAGLDDGTVDIVLTALRARMRQGVLIISSHTPGGLPSSFETAAVLPLENTGIKLSHLVGDCGPGRDVEARPS